MMTDAASTIYAPATASGRAGVAIMRISGSHIDGVVRHLGCNLPAPRVAQYTTLRAGPDGEPLDQGLLLYFPAPYSFTGEDVLEIHCHGSPAVLRALMQHFEALPELRLAEPGEFTRRAYANGKMDLTAAEGLADLLQAESDAQRRQAVRQLNGAHRQLFESLRSRALHSLALLEACIDFSDEDIPDNLFQQIEAECESLQMDITRCLSDWRMGERVREGWQIVILGLPNAGKSSLLNALTGREAAIVSPQAGTTRDIIETTRLIEGHAVTFLDTAGLRDTNDHVERIGVARARERARGAHLRLVVSVAGQSLAETLDVVEKNQSDIPTLLVWNKTDLATVQNDHRKQVPAFWSQCETNALAQGGTQAIESWIATVIQSEIPSGAQPIVTRERHRHALQKAADELNLALQTMRDATGIELQCEHLRRAAQAIGSITGIFTSDDVLGLIFSEFCIGK